MNNNKVIDALFKGAYFMFSLLCIIFFVLLSVCVLGLIPGMLIAAQWGELNFPIWVHIIITGIGIVYTFIVYGYLIKINI